MVTSSMPSGRPTDLEVIRGAMNVCRAHQACTAQVLCQRLEPVCEHLAREPTGAECREGELALIEDTLTWMCGIGAVPTPSLKNGLMGIRERLTQRTRHQTPMPTIHSAA